MPDTQRWVARQHGRFALQPVPEETQQWPSSLHASLTHRAARARPGVAGAGAAIVVGLAPGPWVVDGARDLPPKSELANGAPFGKVGSSPIKFGTRLVLPGVDPFAVDAERLLEGSETTRVDPRNLLPERR